jgi:hypothetical protein
MVSPINDLDPSCVVASAAVSVLFVSNLCGRAQPVEREHVELPLHLHRGEQETRLAVAPLVTHRVVSSFPARHANCLNSAAVLIFTSRWMRKTTKARLISSPVGL